MTENERDSDRKWRADAEVVHRHTQDQSRLIEAQDAYIHELMRPIRERHLLNHFNEEYEELYRRRG